MKGGGDETVMTLIVVSSLSERRNYEGRVWVVSECRDTIAAVRSFFSIKAYSNKLCKLIILHKYLCKFYFQKINQTMIKK